LNKQEKSREDLDIEILQDLRTMKRELKKLSKNQLINLVFNQMNMAMEQKTANEALIEKLKDLGEFNEDNS
jgi:hypothetical protein